MMHNKQSYLSKRKNVLVILLYFLLINPLSAHEFGHQGITYEITPPLKNKNIQNYLFLNVVDEQTNEFIASRFSMIIDGNPFVPDSLGENGIRFTSIHKKGKERYTVTYSKGKNRLFIPLPKGARSGIIFVTKGFEYIPTEVRFDLNRSETVNVSLKRWINLKDKGWLPTDEHLHYDRLHKDFDSDWLNMLEADGLSYGCFLVLEGGGNPGIWGSQYAYGKEGESFNGKSALYTGEEIRDYLQGHINLLGIDTIIHPITTDTKEIPYNYPIFYDVFQKTRELGGIGGPAHGTGIGVNPTGQLDVILGAVDFFEIMNTFSIKLDDWYRLLNCGYNIPPAAGTDLPNFSFRDYWQPFFGETRMYLKVDDEKSTFKSWKKSLKQGKIFVTTGPIINLSVNGAEIGDTLRLNNMKEEVMVSATLECTQPLQKLEIVKNGEVISENIYWEKAADNIYTIKLNKEFLLDKSCWIAARGEGYLKNGLFNRYGVRQNIYAHTAPIIISVDNQPILVKPEAQQMKNDLLIQSEYYLKNAKYKENKHRERMMDLFDRAIILIDDKISGK